MKFVSLPEVCKIQYGFPFDSAQFNDRAGTPLIRIRDVVRGYSETYTTEKVKDEFLVYPEDILIGMDGEFNVAKWGKTPSYLNQRVCRIFPNEYVDKEYLFHYLPVALKKIEDATPFVTVKHLSAKALACIVVPIRELSEQHTISQCLTSIYCSIELRKKQLALLDRLASSRFVEMFGDVQTGHYNFETRKLGDVASVGSSHRVFTTEFVNAGVPFYRGTEIGELANGKRPTNPYFISEDHYRRLANDETKPQVGDLLMPSICNKGQVWMVDSSQPFYYKDGRVLCISPNRSIFDSKFLLYFMREKTLVEYPKMGSGSTFAEFKIFLLKDMDILVPPLALQNEFAAFIEQLDKSKVVVEKTLSRLDFLRRGTYITLECGILWILWNIYKFKQAVFPC